MRGDTGAPKMEESRVSCSPEDERDLREKRSTLKEARGEGRRGEEKKMEKRGGRRRRRRR